MHLFQNMEIIFLNTAGKNSEYSKVFNDAMSSYSAMHTAMVLEALSGYDFSNISHICEIGGGQGHLLSHLQSKYNHLIGTILELESGSQQSRFIMA